MKNVIILLVLLFSNIVNAADLKLKDDSGHILRLKKTPDKVVVLSPEINEIIFALGKGDKIIANTEYCNYPPASEKILKAGSFSNPDLEKIIKLSPDIIFLTKGVQTDVMNKLQELNYPYFVFYITSVKQLYEAVKKISIILNAVKQGKHLISHMKQELRTLKTIKKKAVILPVIWHQPVMVAGGNTIVNDVIKLAGGINPIEHLKDGYFTVSDEYLIAHPVDYILLCGHNLNLNNNKIFRLMKNNKKYNTIKIDPDWILRATPRTIKAVLYLNKILSDK